MRPYPQEQLLIEQLPDVSEGRILCTSPGLAQFAQAAAGKSGHTSVHCHYLDLYHAEQARRSLTDLPENLTIGCAADFPDESFDLVALPLSAHGEAELAREMIQAGHELLVLGGRMMVSTDNAQDSWLGEQMEKLFGRVARRAADAGVVYIGRKQERLRKFKNFAAEFAFRDHAHLIRAYSRPGVFSHRRVDPGARQLMNAFEVPQRARVLDIGCGTGVLSLAAAARDPGVQVLAVDSNARAIQCTQKGAELNHLENVRAGLNASGEVDEKGSFDLVLGNPPYYAAFQIARLFALAGRDALRPGGRILIVTKSPPWYVENMPTWFDDVKVTQSKSYFIVSAIRGDPDRTR